MLKTAKTATSKNKLAFLLLGHLSFATLFIFAIIFFKERIFFSDSSFYFFKIVNFEKINVEAHRYGAVLHEIPLLMAIKLGINLKWLTIIYSVSFILLYYLVFILCTHLLKNISAGLAVIVVLTLCISQSFFHPVTETHQSLVYAIMVYAILQYSEFRYPVIQFVLAITFILISFFAHPVAIYPLSFIIGYSAIDKNQLHSLKPYILLIFTGSLAIGKVLFTNENSYEGKFFSELINSPSIIFDFPSFYSTKFFIDRLNGLYLWLVILELVLITLLIFKKEYIKLIWQLCFLSFFLAITLITYHQGDSDLLMERAFMPLALFIAVPLLNETIKNNFKFTIPKVVLLTIIIGISLNRIYAQGKEFQARTEFSKVLLRKTAKFSNKKFIVHQNKIDRHILTFWSYSIETLLLSAITDDLPTQTIYSANNPEELSKYTTNPNSVFLGPNFWLEWDIQSLNSKYFVLPENTPYKIIDIDNLN